ncbi:MAG: hypothetical protein AMXMBFR25_18830 [Lysobacterales bacterium]|nr:Sensor histidine kinase RcsC [Xanthomonadales bacterium]
MLVAREYSQPYFETIPGSDEVGNGIVTIVTQDARGLLWFGTPEGLYSWDGHRLRAWRADPKNPDAIGDDYVRALMPHSDGSLWVATQSGGLSIYDPVGDRFSHHRPRPGDPAALPSVATLTLAEDAGGDVWIGFGNHGLARWHSASRSFQSFPAQPGVPGSLQHETVRALLVDRRGDLWIGTGNGLHRLQRGSTRFEHMLSDPDLPDGFWRQYVYALFEAQDGRIWIGTQSDGGAILDPLTLALKRLPDGVGGLSHPWVSGFAQPQADRVWIHTYGGGIDVVDAGDGHVVQHVRSDPSMPGSLALDRLTAPFRDRSGLIWTGTWGAGLQRYNPANAASFMTVRHGATTEHGLSMANVLSTLPLDARHAWIGTGGNGIDVLDVEEGVIGGYRPDPRRPGALRDGTIRAMVRDTTGALWVGTQHGGIQRYRPASDDFEDPLPGVPGGPVRQLLARRDGSVVVGMQASLAIVDPASGTARRVHFQDGREFTDPVWSLAEDTDRRLWIGTPNALYHWSAGTPDPVPVVDGGAPLQAATDLEIDARGQLWVAGPRGLARLSDWQDGQPRFEDFGARLEKLPRGFGQQVLADADGRLWSPRVVIDPAREQVEALGVAEGVNIGSVEIGSGSMAPDGRLYFGGTRGLLIVDPARYKPWDYVAPLLLTGIEIDGQRLAGVHSQSGIELQPGQRRLSVEFAALDYSAPSTILYSHRLLGLDDAWIESDADQRLASFHNLWPGRYRLEVRARTRTGNWTDPPLAVPVTVIAAWWQTPTAMLVGLATLMLLLGGITRLRTVRMRLRAQALQALVDERTHELSQAKERAERALVELKGAQRQLVAAEKMASLGQLVAGVAHEINTPIGIAVTAASHLQDVTREGTGKLNEGRFTRQELGAWKQEIDASARLVLSSLERAGTLITSFKQVSVDQSSGQRRRFQLDQFLEEVRTALSPTIRRTPHTLDIECAAGIEMDSFPGALFQILTNLINNALIHAFTPERPGRMRIRAHVDDAGRLEMRFGDDGRGMEAQVVARAFDPFFTTRRSAGGSGLGLHVVHNLVTQLLAGQIQLESEVGGGAEFILLLPLRAPEPTTRPGTQT